MGLNEFLDKEVETTSNELVRVDEGQLIIAEAIKKQMIEFEKAAKEIKKKQEEFKTNIKKVMKENGITKYESNDKQLMITLGEDSITETVDKNKLFLKYPDVYRDEEIVKESKREGSLRITIREGKDE